MNTPARQGRDLTTRMRSSISHKEDGRYIINLHALHNAHILRETLPRHLVALTHSHPNRRELHDTMAAKLRISGPAKRAETAAKAQATRAKRKK